MKKNELSSIYILLAVGVFVISFSGIFIRLAQAPPLIIAFYRMFLSVVFLTPIFLYRYRKKLEYFLDIRPIIVGFFLAIHFLLWITAFEYTNVGNAVIFIAIQPLFTYILEYLFAREDLKKGVLVGIILALIGSLIISLGDLAVLIDKLWGDLLALAAAFFAACYLFRGRNLREEIEYFPYIYLVYTYAALFLGLFTIIGGYSFTGHGFTNYSYFLALALGPTLIGHSVLNYSVRFVPATIVSLAILGEPILTTILAWFLLQEKITVTTFIGGIFILIGIYKASVNKKGD